MLLYADGTLQALLPTHLKVSYENVDIFDQVIYILFIGNFIFIDCVILLCSFNS